VSLRATPTGLYTQSLIVMSGYSSCPARHGVLHCFWCSVKVRYVWRKTNSLGKFNFVRAFECMCSRDVFMYFWPSPLANTSTVLELPQPL
jgi:hypothetical protein